MTDVDRKHRFPNFSGRDPQNDSAGYSRLPLSAEEAKAS